MDDPELLTRWRAERTAPAVGWDFSALDGRMTEDEPPWDFAQECRTALAGATSALDMGTGGGERLLALGAALPADTVATEGWPPNLAVARNALAPYGIEVVPYDAETDDPARRRMPFPTGRFDVVMNRHEAMLADETARVLSPGGVLLTQQVGTPDTAERKSS